MKLKVLNISTNKSTSTEVADTIFAREFNQSLVHQVTTAYMSGGRQGSKAQKNRAAVSGGGKKPWAQKGTGRARAGTSRGPIWRSGGVTFAAQPRSYAQKVNKKMYKGAISVIFSELVRSERLKIVNDFEVKAAFTGMKHVRPFISYTVAGDYKLKGEHKALNEFAQYCHRTLLDCSLVAGVEGYLEELKVLEVPIFIVSGGNEMEIKEVFKAKQIDHYFRGIYGNPKPKEQCLEELLSSGIVNGKGLFYGDAALDYELATTSDMDFVFVYGVSEWKAGLSFCQDNQLPCIKSFLDV